MQHEAQTGTFRRQYGLLEVALTARWDIVHLRPDVRHGELSGVAYVEDLLRTIVQVVRRTSQTS